MGKYKFTCAGQFAGVTSFTDDDGEPVNLMKIDFMGGKANVSITPDTADKYASKKTGCDIRVTGEVIVGGGSFKPFLQTVKFEDDKDFEPVSAEESFAGLLFSGPGYVSGKRSYTRRDGTAVCEVDFQLFGASLKLAVPPEHYDQIAEGQVMLFGKIVSDVVKNYKGELSSRNWLTIHKAQALADFGRKRG